MAIDIRADVSCSLGTIISGNIGDDYLQGSGLIKTQGSVLISGLITPSMGTVVTFDYTKQGITRNIPRKLRVLSSFADPFRRTTQVELGCKLTYVSDLKEPIKWSAFNDPLNAEYTEDDSAIVTLPIRAASIAKKCLAKIGIISSSMPLTNSFSIAEFDFSSGYVDILSNLLVSESYFGYLDKNEVLQIESLDQESGSGPVYTSSDIIDLGSIGVGQLPGEAVTVSYSTLKLKVPTLEEAEAADGGATPPEEDPPGGVVDPSDPDLTEEEAEELAEEIERLNWELVKTFNSPQNYYVPFKRTIDGVEYDLVQRYSGATSSEIRTKYKTIEIKKEEPEEESEEEAIQASLFFIGPAVFPSYSLIGNTASFTEQQQIDFESNPESVLEEVWPDAEKYDRVADGFDDWVYLDSGWELNPPTIQERFETEPESVLSEFFPTAKPYDYVSDGTIKWISSGSGGWEKQDEESNPETPEPPAVEKRDVPILKVSTERGPLISVASSVAQDYLSNGYNFFNEEITISETTETFTYDAFGNQTGSKVEKRQSQLGVLASVSLNWADGDVFIVYDNYFESATLPTETIITSNETVDSYTKDVTSTYKKYAFTQNGQQQIAKATEDSPTIPDSINIINYVIDSELVHENTEVTVSRKGITTSQSRPPQSERINANYAKGSPTKEEKEAGANNATSSASGGEGESDPNNGWSTESKSELVLALGSAAAERRIEFSLPYAPDDIFVGPSGGPFFAFRSAAEQKAMQYGRVQNRLLLGNRSGISLQLSPERLPTVPFGPIYVEANGLTALYRVNGASWAFDSSGIVASTDALFWAAVGGTTGEFWFPVAPGIVSLPESPVVVNTAPTQVVGSVETVGSTPQSILNTAFPDADTGDGVQDEVTGNFWTYNGTTWTNVGPTPGLTTTASTIVPPYNEIAIYTGRLRVGTVVRKFDYTLELFTVVPALKISTESVVERTFSIGMPFSSIAIAGNVPILANSVNVRVSAIDMSIQAAVPLVGTEIGSAVIATPVLIAIAPVVPFVGSYIARVPVTNVAVASPLPTVGRAVGSFILNPVVSITVEAPALTIQSSTPQAVSLFVPVSSIAVDAFVPAVESTSPQNVSVLAPVASIAVEAIAPTTTPSTGLDVDALTYIAAVESADGQSLETVVKTAINNFVLGCKTDGTWSAIKAACILAGARTLSGALTPLVGTAPTNFNFWGAADPNWANVSLLLRMNGANASTTFADSSQNAFAVTTFGNAQISTTQSKFGGSSGLFDGNGDWCKVANNAAFKFGSGNFTIEYWFYPTSLTGVKQHINPDDGSNTSYAIITSGSSLLYYLSSAGGSTWDIASGVSIGTSTLNTWQHVALVRNGNVFTPYLNGIAGTSTTSSAALFDFTSQLTIGSDGPASPLTPFQGHMDDFRITKGVARYTANFTPPTQTHPGVASDYNRKTGLVGDGSTKYLNSNRNNNADPQDNRHLSAWVSAAPTSAVGRFPAHVSAGGNADGATGIGRLDNNSSALYSRNVNSDFQSVANAGSATAFMGTSRSASGSYVVRHSGNSSTLTQISEAPANARYGVFREMDGTTQAGIDATYSDARLAFYSIGESLDLALLDTRVDRLVAEMAFAINTGLDGSTYDIDTLKYVNAGYAAGGTLS